MTAYERHKMNNQQLHSFWEGEKGKFYIYRCGTQDDIVQVIGTYHEFNLVGVKHPNGKIHMYHYKSTLLTPLLLPGTPAQA